MALKAATNKLQPIMKVGSTSMDGEPVATTMEPIVINPGLASQTNNTPMLHTAVTHAVYTSKPDRPIGATTPSVTGATKNICGTR